MAKARRLWRIDPLIKGLNPIAQSIGRTQSQRNVGFQVGRPASTPQQAYQAGQPVPIIGGYAASVVPASGTVTVYVGPQGVGTVWYPQAAAISTTSGANDASTCALYLSPFENSSTALAPSTQIGGQSYAGGGDTIGLAVPPLWPGYFIVAVWTGAKHNDLAALAVYGTQSTLVS